MPDKEVLAFAAKQGRVLLTINKRDFLRLHNEGVAHGGLILCSQDPDVQGQAECIHQELQKAGDIKGQEIRIIVPHKGFFKSGGDEVIAFGAQHDDCGD